MSTIRIKDVVLGEGIPKICVPIMGKTKEEIITEAAGFKELPIDIAEWRADWFEDINDISKLKSVLEELAATLDKIPLLFTFRTLGEGGNKAIDKEEYGKLINTAVASGCIDLTDIEVFTGDAMVKKLIDYAHKNGVTVIASNHDFDKTPSVDDMIYRMRKMQDLGADILKIAVMPKNKLDVLDLLKATVIMKEKYTDKPVVTMSMASKGGVSRVLGEVFGSALTFGALKKTSAPGQIEVRELKKILDLLHKNHGDNNV